MRILTILLVILMVGCTGNVNKEGLVNFPDDSNMSFVTTTNRDSAVSTTLPQPQKDDKSTITVNEGDLLKLNLKATDPDNNPISYTFSSPLDNKGQWQTAKGDAGTYNVIVTASDGKLSTTKNLKIIVKSTNGEPSISNFNDIKEIMVNEGDTIKIEPKIVDPEKDEVKVKYSGFLNANTYTTSYTDAGEYSAKIELDDGHNKVIKDIKIIVKNVNRAPALGKLEDITVTENDKIEIKALATDLDGDKVTIKYSKPLNDEGAWQTKEGDAGEYNIKVTASDKDLSEVKSFKILVNPKNKPPVIEDIQPIIIKEGQTVIITPKAEDSDGDKVTISYSGWMKNNIYQTTYDDQGTHFVTVTADDGKIKVSKDIKIEVEDVNRAPENFEIEISVTPGN